MSISKSKILQDLNINENTLKEILNNLDYTDIATKEKSTIPEEIAYILYGIRFNGDSKRLIKKIIQDETNINQEVFNDIKIVGHIKLEDHTNDKNTYDYYSKENIGNLFRNKSVFCNHTSFWLEEIYISSDSGEVHPIKVGDFIEYSESPLFSVMIGANGVGKSVLLSEVADFLIDLHLYQENKHDQISNYKGHIRALCYHIDGQKCFVARTPKAYVAKIGQYLSPIKNLIVPAVVASHFGAFDKFHNQSVNNVKRTKYDEDKYKYVGAHINGNITSASSISFRLLFALITAANNKQITNIIDILKFIKYDSLISLHYSKIRIRKDFKEHLKRYVFNDKDYEKSTNEYKTKIITNLCNIYNSIKNNDRFIINLHDEKSIYSNKDILQYLYKLKQYNLIKDTKVTFFKNGKEIMPEGMSSGEFMVLSTILSISLAVNHSHTIVLLDEPEISLHPNWQMSFIEIIDEALKFKNCHLLIATHSHMIVSDLPMKRSKVVQLKLDKEGNIQSQFIEGSTYGWSAEEVLLKVFNTATDRNRYLTECISILLEKMGNNEISCEDVSNELEHLKEVSKHLSKIDPLKEVLETIFKVYKY